MARYHINNEGNAGKCSAMVACPFGDLDKAHYSSAAEARAAVEKRFKKEEIKAERKESLLAPRKLLKFEELRHFDYHAQERERARIYRDGDNDQANEFWATYSGEQDENFTLEKDRLQRVMSQNAGEETTHELIATGQVNVGSPLASAVVNSNYGELAGAVARADAATKEKFYHLPTKYHSALVSGKANAAHSASSLKALVSFATEQHAANPAWKPTARQIIPRVLARYAYSPGGARAAGERVGQAPDMQHIAPETYSLLEDGVKRRVGEDRADEFWNTVHSTSSNKPKLSDFFFALKNFR